MTTHKEADKLYADLAMKITNDRATWMLRCWILANMLKQHGIEVEHILQEMDIQKLSEILANTIDSTQQEQPS